MSFLCVPFLCVCAMFMCLCDLCESHCVELRVVLCVVCVWLMGFMCVLSVMYFEVV